MFRVIKRIIEQVIGCMSFRLCFSGIARKSSAWIRIGRLIVESRTTRPYTSTIPVVGGLIS
jgi:hypothetical protein